MHLASYASTNSLRDGFAGVDVFIIDTYVHRKSSNGLNPLCVRRLFRSGWRPFSRPIQPLEDMHATLARTPSISPFTHPCYRSCRYYITLHYMHQTHTAWLFNYIHPSIISTMHLYIIPKQPPPFQPSSTLPSFYQNPAISRNSIIGPLVTINTRHIKRPTIPITSPIGLSERDPNAGHVE